MLTTNAPILDLLLGTPMPSPSLHTTHLQDCFQRMRAGDRSAEEELLRAAGARLEALARRMLRGFPIVRRLADTGDVFQESVLRLLRSLRQLDRAPGSVREFLGLAATHIRRELVDLARRCRADKRRGDVPLDAAGSGPGIDPTASAEDADDLDNWRRFHEEVEKLPVEEREVINLRFYHGWSLADIASLFGVSERSVRRRWAAGCVRLSEALGDQMPAP
jgi:RNA polymerase sigma factor (sigma-70 family)